VRNPRTGEVDYHVDTPASDELDAVCRRLRKAQVSWRSEGLDHRINALRKWSTALLESRSKIAAALSADTGRGRESELEIDIVGRSVDRWSSLAPALLDEGDARTASIPTIQIASDSIPYQLASVISPWNFPLLLSMIDTLPALLAGCAVIVKPSEVTPRFIEPLMKTIRSAGPLSDVLAFVPGDGSTGAQLIERVDVIAFTGSIPTGKKVAQEAAKRFIPAFLELGGKDPAVVLESADLDRATSACLWGSVVNAGQSCQSIERIYVASPIFEDFVGRLIEKAKAVRLAHPTPESGEIGPIIAARQAEVIEEQLRDAVSKGAKIHSGGEIEQIDGGLWCRPTVVTNVDHSMKLMSEETFGPIMPVMPFNTADEAVDLANDSIYGLSAAVFAATDEEAVAVARRINAGAVSVNDAALTAFIQEAEKNSFNLSGLGGSRMGPAALRRFMRRKAFLIQTSDQPDPWWFSQPPPATGADAKTR
jgi:succinate-semialdehyde dehydrogenase/glutarate-semialdehyde dehydrogenase